MIKLIATDVDGTLVKESSKEMYPEMIEVIRKLEEYGLKMEIEESVQEATFAGLTFVVTGTLPTLSRKEAAALIENHGGKVTGSVSKKTNYLLAGENAGSKLDKAKNLGIHVISEDDLLKMIK